MRHLELQHGSAEILNERMMMGDVARCVQAGLDARDQGIEAFAHGSLFRLQAAEFRAQVSQRLA